MATTIDFDPRRSALVVYDFTRPIAEVGHRSYSQWAVDGMPTYAQLVRACRKSGVLVCYALGSAGYGGFDVCHEVAPVEGERSFMHNATGAFTGTDLDAYLTENRRDTLFVSGVAVDRDCNTTARQAQIAGLRPIMVRGACYTYPIAESPFGPVSTEELERVHLAALHRQGIPSIPIAELIDRLGSA